jgi:hypothetical protein
MIDGEAFITPHAVRQFQNRIAAIPYDRARRIIIEHLREHAVSVSPMPDGNGIRVRVRGGDFSFRAVVMPAGGRAERPAVVTILRSGK